MSNVTLPDMPDELAAKLTTPEGMARARAAVLAAFGMGDQAESTADRARRLDREHDERLRTRAWRTEAE
jgi:hypothetical protein